MAAHGSLERCHQVDLELVTDGGELGLLGVQSELAGQVPVERVFQQPLEHNSY